MANKTKAKAATGWGQGADELVATWGARREEGEEGQERAAQTFLEIPSLGTCLGILGVAWQACPRVSR